MDAQQIEEFKRALDAAQAALEAAQELGGRRDALEAHHQLTMRQALVRAADVQQANTNKLEREVATLKERADQAQEDRRILQLVEEQRRADQAWDLAIAQRTALCDAHRSL